MSKRRNVNGQMRREEYDALMEGEREEDSSGANGLAQGFQKASADVLKKRRIVRVSRDKLASKMAQAKTNPFANTKLAPSESASPKANPFAFITLTTPQSAKKTTDLTSTTTDAPTTTKLQQNRESDSAENIVTEKDNSTKATTSDTTKVMNESVDLDGTTVEKNEASTKSTPQVNVRVGVGVLVQDPKSPEKVFAGKRKGSHGAGKLALPGGHLEMLETWEVCAAREVEEETGLKIENIKFAHVTNDPMPDEGKHYITIFMIATCAKDSDRPKNLEPNKCEGWDSYSLKDLVNVSSGKDNELSLFGPLKHLIDESPQSLKDFLANK